MIIIVGKGTVSAVRASDTLKGSVITRDGEPGQRFPSSTRKMQEKRRKREIYTSIPKGRIDVETSCGFNSMGSPFSILGLCHVKVHDLPTPLPRQGTLTR